MKIIDDLRQGHLEMFFDTYGVDDAKSRHAVAVNGDILRAAIKAKIIVDGTDKDVANMTAKEAAKLASEVIATVRDSFDLDPN